MWQNLDLRFLSFIDFCQDFFPPIFRFFDLAFYYLFSFFDLFFYRSLFSLSFSLLFCTFFFTYVVSSLAYPNLLMNKRLGCCCCYHQKDVRTYLQPKDEKHDHQILRMHPHHRQQPKKMGMKQYISAKLDQQENGFRELFFIFIYTN
jgi:hypothetical protein